MDSILQAYPEQVGVVDRVIVEEVHFVRQHRPGTREQMKVPIDLHPLLTNGLLVNIPYTDDDAETALYMAFLGAHNGESFTAAVANRISWGISSDDGGTRIIVQDNFPHIPVITTSFMIKNWSETFKVSSQDTKTAIQNMRSWGGL
jgi:hypothetical protein